MLQAITSLRSKKSVNKLNDGIPLPLPPPSPPPTPPPPPPNKLNGRIPRPRPPLGPRPNPPGPAPPGDRKENVSFDTSRKSLSFIFPKLPSTTLTVPNSKIKENARVRVPSYYILLDELTVPPPSTSKSSTTLTPPDSEPLGRLVLLSNSADELHVISTFFSAFYMQPLYDVRPYFPQRERGLKYGLVITEKMSSSSNVRRMVREMVEGWMVEDLGYRCVCGPKGKGEGGGGGGLRMRWLWESELGEVLEGRKPEIGDVERNTKCLP